jgi:hypothetical protein
MPLITEIQIPEFPSKMDYSKSILFFGSCFSENIGQRMIDLKYRVDMNPFGILYNPQSIANSLKFLLDQQQFKEKDLFQDQGLWNSLFHHSRFSDVDKEVVLYNINRRLIESHNFLKMADFLVITFGTAWAYELVSTGQVVSNCHKVASSFFNRVRLSTDEISVAYRLLLEQLWNFNPKLKVIFTISPIRHWKDGAVENQVSKSTLILAVDHLRNDFAERGLSYFPSYELMMDELRDYRFYAEDMIHLSSVAIDYIFDRFSQYLISKESENISKKVLKIRKSMLHRPVNTESAEYERFLRQTLVEIGELNTHFPNLDFEDEKSILKQKIEGFKNQSN